VQGDAEFDPADMNKPAHLILRVVGGHIKSFEYYN
jgi:hypothetical protein